ncbi:hypothetical protein CVT25_002443 [Psilocybe cyanescens]|uniref:Translocon Sec61/SecY plug domain-containing protein n=1 Tax=Psilocybe cyanescens TaxID=93625 RepID=A0A409XF62_PSICY|nr:hypothetical protein CVT25_002443 [Psilocybe cyanescens]
MHATHILADLIWPCSPILPEVSSPDRKVPSNQKVIWTTLKFLVFLVFSQVPLYGIMSSDSSDPLYWIRVILASNCGTLMELGITLIIALGMIVQLLAGANLFDVGFSPKENRALFSATQKLFALIITLGQATVYGSRPAVRPRGRGLPLARHPAHRHCNHRHPPRRAPPERVRSRIGRHVTHRDQHLQVDQGPVQLKATNMNSSNTPYLLVPLYGIMSSDSSDLLYWIRVILASNRGTLMELGITPIISSLLMGGNLISVYFSVKQGSGLVRCSEILRSHYCPRLIHDLRPHRALKPASIVWKAFSPTTVNIGRGSEIEGALVALFYLLFSWHDKGRALREALWRERLLDLMSVISTEVIFAVIPVKSNRFREQRGAYPIKLFYASDIERFDEQCVHCVTEAADSRVGIFADVRPLFFCHFFHSVPFRIQLLEDSPQLRATGGIGYDMSPPQTLKEAVLDSIHAATYIAFMLSACALFIKT